MNKEDKNIPYECKYLLVFPYWFEFYLEIQKTDESFKLEHRSTKTQLPSLDIYRSHIILR